MEELLELRKCIEEQRYPDALLLIGELEEMSREDKINKIYSYAVILLLHLIKQEAEKRSTRSWDFSVCNSLSQIAITNVKNENLYSARGQTNAGRYLTVIFIYKLSKEALIVTARNMDSKERRSYVKK